MGISFLDNREVTLAGEVAEALDHCQQVDVAVAFARQSAREVLGEPPSNPATALCKAYALTPERQRALDMFHIPKNLPMSIAIEAAELMENFQWLDSPRSSAIHSQVHPGRLSRTSVWALLRETIRADV